jgi:hypothetical protein
MIKKVLIGFAASIAVFIIIAVIATATSGNKATPVAKTSPPTAVPTAVPAAVSTAAASLSPSSSTVQATPSSTSSSINAVYADVCKLLGAGESSSDVTNLTSQQLKKDSITGYTGPGIVKTAEQKDCPQYISTPSSAPSKPAMTASEQQAVTSAQSYLNLGSGFSSESLLQQLTSSYGSGFAKSDAEFAVGYLHPNWDAQAVDAARGYMKLGTGFSRSSLIQQLTSSYGNGFTETQAEYAASKVGL